MVKVVIIGANYAGGKVATDLGGKPGVEVTVVDKRPFWENSLATPLAIAHEPAIDAIIKPHSKHFDGAKFIVGEATGITADGVTVNGETLSYDYLVVSTGASYPLFKDHTAVTEEARKGELKAKYDEIKAAKQVLVLGAGIVGVETAGEIKYRFPEKTVTLVASSAGPLPGVANEATAKKIANTMVKMGINSHYNDRVEGDVKPGDSVTTKNGVELGQVDSVVRCVGGWKVNSDWLKGSVLADALDEHGGVKVSKTLQVVGHANVFAAGDIATPEDGAPPTRSAAVAMDQAGHIAKSILALSKNKDHKVVEFKGPAMAAFTIGKKHGFLVKPDSGGTIPAGWVIKKVKYATTWWTSKMGGDLKFKK